MSHCDPEGEKIVTQRQPTATTYQPRLKMFESDRIFDGIHTWLATARTRVSGIVGVMDMLPKAPVQFLDLFLIFCKRSE
jgi:hypothetical protein